MYPLSHIDIRIDLRKRGSIGNLKPRVRKVMKNMSSFKPKNLAGILQRNDRKVSCNDIKATMGCRSPKSDAIPHDSAGRARWGDTTPKPPMPTG